MKNIQLLLLVGLLYSFTACKSDDKDPVCDGDCIFSLNDASGTIVNMACFGKYGIKTLKPGGDSTYIYGIPDAMDVTFAEDGKAVTFSGTFRANTLEILFPDPGLDLNAVFQMKISDID